MKKLLATIASLALTGGALLGVATPAFADEATPVSEPTASETPAPENPAPDAEPSTEPAPAEPLVQDPAPQPQGAPPTGSAAVPAASQSTARSPQPEQQGRGNSPQKVWVCKIVSSDNSPSGFRLKEGKQPIHVSVNALGDDVNDTGTFNDRQPSFVVDSDDASLCSHTEETVEEEVVCPTDESNGVVNITTTTTQYFGTTVVSSSASPSARDLTDQELRECGPPPVKVYVCEFVRSEQHPSGWVLKRGDQPVPTWTRDLGRGVNDTGDFDPDQPSFIVASDDRSLCASMQEERSTVVTCPAGDDDGFATITTVHTYFYGSVKVNETSRDKYRELTDAEMEECDPYVEPLVATAEISFEDATCEVPQQLILGPIVNATWGEITDPDGPANYSVTATADPGAQFPAVGPALRAVVGSTTLTFTGILEPQLDPSSPECDLVTLGLVMPAVTFSQASCDAGGTYTLGVAEGYDPALVTFTVDGVAGIASGTYPVAASGSVLVTAQVVAPNGFEFGWSDPPAFAFVVPSDEDCTDAAIITTELPTLAYTGGGSSTEWWLIAITMIGLGGAAVYVRRQMNADLS